MRDQNLSIGPRKTWLSLENEQTAGEKCSWWYTNALQFRSIRMSTNTPHRKRDFGSTVRITALQGYRGINEVAR